jgi:hypothetical protein
MDLLTMIGLAKQLIGWAVTQAMLLRADGDITEEQLQAIRNKAGLSDAAWDEAVAAARQRLEQGR